MEKAKSPLEIAINRAGGQRRLSGMIGWTQQAISLWHTKKKPVPAEAAIRIEQATGIPRQELRPDLFGLSSNSNERGAA